MITALEIWSACVSAPEAFYWIEGLCSVALNLPSALSMLFGNYSTTYLILCYIGKQNEKLYTMKPAIHQIYRLSRLSRRRYRKYNGLEASEEAEEV